MREDNWPLLTVSKGFFETLATKGEGLLGWFLLSCWYASGCKRFLEILAIEGGCMVYFNPEMEPALLMAVPQGLVVPARSRMHGNLHCRPPHTPLP